MRVHRINLSFLPIPMTAAQSVTEQYFTILALSKAEPLCIFLESRNADNWWEYIEDIWPQRTKIVPQ